MPVTTKKGDAGTTGLLFNRRVPKSHTRLSAYGDVDEACSFLGLARASITDPWSQKLIREIQVDLFTIGAELACENRDLKRLTKKISENDVARLDAHVADLEKKANRPQGFIVPGGSVPGATLDVARTVLRRAERGSVALMRRNMLKNPSLLQYLNRLSDLVYLLARHVEETPDAL